MYEDDVYDDDEYTSAHRGIDLGAMSVHLWSSLSG